MLDEITKEIYLRMKRRPYKYSPVRIDGLKVLAIVISKFGAEPDIRNYILLLKATYGERNVTLSGASYRREVKTGVTTYTLDEKGFPVGREATTEFSDFTGKTGLSSKEVVGLLADEVYAERWVGKYDQVHFVGHGFEPPFRKEGFIFFEDGKRKSFDEVKGDWSEDISAWPLRGEGTKIVLAGCYTERGGMKAFLELVVGVGNVFGVSGDFFCECKKEQEKYVALDWYHEDQKAVIGQIGDFLGIAGAAGVRPARPLKRLMELKVTPQPGLEVEVEK